MFLVNNFQGELFLIRNNQRLEECLLEGKSNFWALLLLVLLLVFVVPLYHGKQYRISKYFLKWVSFHGE
jgi:hypothetical protein